MKIVVGGTELRGDMIRSAVLRSDAVPVPTSLEAEIRVIDDSIMAGLAEGKVITVGAAEDQFWIIKTVQIDTSNTQGSHREAAIGITAILDSCHTVAFVRDKPICKEKATLSQIYNACGASLQAIDADFPVERFSCFSGETPSFHIARILQENGGILRWKAGKMKYFRLQDLLKQTPVMTIPDRSAQDVASGFSERHQVQSFYSVDPTGAFIYGNQAKARWMRFMPNASEQQLKNMTRCLILRKIAKIGYSESIAAGDLIAVTGGESRVVVTAAHVLRSGTDGAGAEQYTKLWLSSVEE